MKTDAIETVIKLVIVHFGARNNDYLEEANQARAELAALIAKNDELRQKISDNKRKFAERLQEERDGLSAFRTEVGELRATTPTSLAQMIALYEIEHKLAIERYTEIEELRGLLRDMSNNKLIASLERQQETAEALIVEQRIHIRELEAQLAARTKPTVWVKAVRFMYHPERIAHYELCTPDGDIIKIQYDIDKVEEIQDIFDKAKIVATVRVWEPQYNVGQKVHVGNWPGSQLIKQIKWLDNDAYHDYVYLVDGCDTWICQRDIKVWTEPVVCHEPEKSEQDAFIEHLKAVSKMVSEWPDWMKNIIYKPQPAVTLDELEVAE
jgi:hypothetical protein